MNQDNQQQFKSTYKPHREIPQAVADTIANHITFLNAEVITDCPIRMEMRRGAITFFPNDSRRSGAIGGPFRHGDAARAWLDGYQQAVISNRGNVQDARNEGFEAAKRQFLPRHRILIMRTTTLWTAHLVFDNNKTEMIDHAGNPSYKLESLVAILLDRYGANGIGIEVSHATTPVTV